MMKSCYVPLLASMTLGCEGSYELRVFGEVYVEGHYCKIDERVTL